MKVDIGGWDSTGDSVGRDIEGLGWAVYREGKVIALFEVSKDAEEFYAGLCKVDDEEKDGGCQCYDYDPREGHQPGCPEWPRKSV